MRLGRRVLPKPLERVLRTALGRPEVDSEAERRALRAAVERPAEQPAAIRKALDALVFEIRAARVSDQAGPAFAALRGQKGLKVHLGCGYDVRPGWLNLDLAVDDSPARRNAGPGAQFISYDLRRGLPLDEGSCDLIYSSHFFEHLEYADGVNLMRASWLALRPGGVFRIVIPDYRTICSAFASGDQEYFSLLDLARIFPDIPPGLRALSDSMNYAMYQFGQHRCIYDEEKLRPLLTDIGFREVVRSDHRDDVDPDDSLRRRYSLYVEATK
jgi:predicted SAM-dependent methyltransferase